MPKDPDLHPQREKSEQLLMTFYEKQRLIDCNCHFSSNVHRVQQIISKSAEYGRKVAITGRSMLNIVGVATELEYMTVPDGVLVDINV